MKNKPYAAPEFGDRFALPIREPEHIMDPLLISAASGMKSRMESLDMLANDIANSGTAGFKTDGEFYGLYQQELPVLEKQWTDFSQGTLTPTGNPLDLALSGDGFFALNSPTGTVYTRKGEFRLSKRNQLQTPEGYTLRNAADNGKPIQVDPAQPFDIAADGSVLQGGMTVGQIEIDGIDSPSQALSKLGNSYFAKLPNTASTKAAAVVHQGMLEQSNVGVADAAVKLVSVMRQFEMLQKAMTSGAEMNRQAIEEVAKVS
ncbi:MAG TPA: flagellar hook basal-body protein [Bryobacteraceae bacterium]|jgi:flagellar basal body rod protein FlgG